MFLWTFYIEHRYVILTHIITFEGTAIVDQEAAGFLVSGNISTPNSSRNLGDIWRFRVCNRTRSE